MVKIEKWFSNLSLEHKSQVFNEPIGDFDGFNGFEEADNYFTYKWSRVGNIVKESLYNYLNGQG